MWTPHCHKVGGADPGTPTGSSPMVVIFVVHQQRKNEALYRPIRQCVFVGYNQRFLFELIFFSFCAFVFLVSSACYIYRVYPTLKLQNTRHSLIPPISLSRLFPSLPHPSPFSSLSPFPPALPFRVRRSPPRPSQTRPHLWSGDLFSPPENFLKSQIAVDEFQRILTF